MVNWTEDEEGYCSAAEDFQDARAVCEDLDIPLHKADFSAEYRARVFERFLADYRAGKTPNPDVLCNREVKFQPFREHALRLGADFIATGHYEVLTKRSGRLLKLSDELPWPRNVWMGVSVENTDYARRIDHLRGTDAHVKFLSLEPLIGPLPDLDLSNIDWVIVGGESGPGARPMDPGWVREIRDQCIEAGVAFFFKQWGGVFKKHSGRKLDERTWGEYPAAAPA